MATGRQRLLITCLFHFPFKVHHIQRSVNWCNHVPLTKPKSYSAFWKGYSSKAHGRSHVIAASQNPLDFLSFSFFLKKVIKAPLARAPWPSQVWNGLYLLPPMGKHEWTGFTGRMPSSSCGNLMNVWARTCAHVTECQVQSVSKSVIWISALEKTPDKLIGI